MSGSGTMHELANMVDHKGDIEVRESEVLKTINHAPIKSGFESGSPSVQESRLSDGSGVRHGLHFLILNRLKRSTTYLV